jgi:hypothetical protein
MPNRCIIAAIFSLAKIRSYAQKNPTQEYKRESFAMFETLLNTINIEIVKALSSVAIDENTIARMSPLFNELCVNSCLAVCANICATSISTCAKSAKEVLPVWLNCCKRVFSSMEYAV